jgi:hypothetical protein
MEDYMKQQSISRGEQKLTWKEIKDLIEAAGVKDNDEIDDIDISWGDVAELEIEKDEVFGWKVRL